MSLVLAITAEENTIAPALLAAAKTHMRVDWAYDDTYITSAIARAISLFQQKTNVSVNKATCTWQPDASEFCDGAARIPLAPVSDVVAMVGGTDVTAQYALRVEQLYGVGVYRVAGAWQDGLTFTLTAGFPDVAHLDPGIANAVLIGTAHLYEHREILVPGLGTEPVMPVWFADACAQYWMPRV